MASKAATDILVAYLTANWTTTPIFDANEEGLVPADGSAFLTYEFPVADEEQITLGAVGARIFRETGAMRVTLSIPAGDGLSSALMTPFETLRALFRGTQTGTATSEHGAVNLWAPTPPIIDDATDEKAYYEMHFAVPFYMDVLG